MHFGVACGEIKTLRGQVGELEWTNRELVHAVKEKNSQIKHLLQKIERVEDVLRRKAEKRKAKAPPPRILTEKEQLAIDMENLRNLSLLKGPNQNDSRRRREPRQEPESELLTRKSRQVRSLRGSGSQQISPYRPLPAPNLNLDATLEDGDRWAYQGGVRQFSPQTPSQALTISKGKISASLQDLKRAVGFLNP